MAFFEYRRNSLSPILEVDASGRLRGTGLANFPNVSRCVDDPVKGDQEGELRRNEWIQLTRHCHMVRLARSGV